MISITSACSRLRRSPGGGWCVEQALRACSTHHPPFFTRRSRASPRREKAKPLRIRHALRKPLNSACSRPGSLCCAVPRGGVRLERAEKGAGDRRYRVNGSKECSFVGFRWLVEAAHLAHELQRGCTNLFLGHRRFEVEKRLDVSTHTCSLDCYFWLLVHYSKRKRKKLLRSCSTGTSVRETPSSVLSRPASTGI